MPLPTKSSLNLFNRFFRELGRGKTTLLLILGIGLADVILHGAIRYSSQMIIDDVLPGGNWSLLLKVCGVLALIAGVQIATGFIQEFTSKKLTGTFTNKIKRKLMRHIQKLPLHKIQGLKVGGVVTRLQSDTEGMGNMLAGGVITPLRGVIMLGVGLAFIFTLNPLVAAWYLLFCLVAGIIALGFMHLMRPRQKNIRSEMARVNAWLTESIKGFAVVRSFTKDLSESLRFTRMTHTLWRRQLKVSVINMAAHRFSWAVYWGLVILLWMVGGYFVTRGKMTIGQLVAFHLFMEFLFDPVFMILHSISELQTGLACTERTFDLLDDPVEFKRPFSGNHLDKIESVAFENVSFHYPGSDPVLEDVSFSITPGKLTAIVGPSGAGKSTVLNLLARFYRTLDGNILVNGESVENYRLDAYRQKVAIALQEVILFDGTIRDNIAMARPESSFKEIEEAARAASCYEFIRSQGDGFDSMIGENGIQLSGGERQRIALARTLLVKPDLLLLDEATSQLDIANEAAVYKNISELYPDMTVVTVAHRLAAVKEAQNILVFEKGRVTSTGNHGKLMANPGYYSENISREPADKT